MCFVTVSSLSVAERWRFLLTGAERAAMDALVDDPREAAIDLAGVADRDLVSTMFSCACIGRRRTRILGEYNEAEERRATIVLLFEEWQMRGIQG